MIHVRGEGPKAWRGRVRGHVCVLSTVEGLSMRKVLMVTHYRGGAGVKESKGR